MINYRQDAATALNLTRRSTSRGVEYIVKDTLLPNKSSSDLKNTVQELVRMIEKVNPRSVMYNKLGNDRYEVIVNGSYVVRLIYREEINSIEVRASHNGFIIN